MIAGSGSTSWRPLDDLRRQFVANLGVLSSRDPALGRQLAESRPAESWSVAVSGQEIHLAVLRAGRWHVPPATVSAASATAIAKKVFASDQRDHAALVAGLDRGHLWHRLWQIRPSVTNASAARLYLLAGSLERLWITLHLHDWADLLGDERVRVYAGAFAARQLVAQMESDASLPLPETCVTVDPDVWTDGLNGQRLCARVNHARVGRRAFAARPARPVAAGPNAAAALSPVRAGAEPARAA